MVPSRKVRGAPWQPIHIGSLKGGIPAPHSVAESLLCCRITRAGVSMGLVLELSDFFNCDCSKK